MIRIKNQGPKKLGQSTVEYLLVITVASFFVLSLAVYMNPKLSSMLSQMEDIVAAKIRGGELVTHYKGGAGGGGAGETLASAKGEGGGSERGGEGEGSEGVGSGVGSISSRPDMGDLEEGSPKGQKAAPVSSEGGGGEGEGESSSGILASGGRGARSSDISAPSQEQKTEGQKEKAATEEDKSAKGRGILYQEGQEEEAVGGSQFNWMRLILMLLIFIVVIFMAFEIYKSIKLSRK